MKTFKVASLLNSLSRHSTNNGRDKQPNTATIPDILTTLEGITRSNDKEETVCHIVFGNINECRIWTLQAMVSVRPESEFVVLTQT